jgi:hypothetical protein
MADKYVSEKHPSLLFISSEENEVLRIQTQLFKITLATGANVITILH